MGLLADAGAIGAAPVGIAVVIRVIDAGEAGGAGEVTEAAAELPVLHRLRHRADLLTGWGRRDAAR